MSGFGSLSDHRDPGSGWFGLQQTGAPAGPSRNTRLIATAVAAIVFVLGLVLFLHLYLRYVRSRRRDRSTPTVLPSALDLTAAVASATQDDAVAKTGLEPSAIAALPSFAYGTAHKPSSAECAVCLSGVQEGDVVRALPACGHVFHVGCIDLWLASSSSCPVCRAMVEPPPQPAAAGRLQEKREGEKEEAGSSVSARLGASLRRMLSREWSSGRRLQGEHGVGDVERQLHQPPVN